MVWILVADWVVTCARARGPSATSRASRSPCSTQPEVVITNTQARSGMPCVAVQGALRPIRHAVVEVGQDGAAAALLEAQVQEAVLADRAALHLRRLVLERRELRGLVAPSASAAAHGAREDVGSAAPISS